MTDSATKSAFPLGAVPGAGGTHFSIFSERAEGIDLLLFDLPSSPAPHTVVPLRYDTPPVWHCHVPDVGPGQLYGFRVHGPYDPSRSLWTNPNKAVLDPYARAIAGDFVWDDALYPYQRNGADVSMEPDARDSTPFVPKCVVVDSAFDWGDDQPPAIPWDRTVIYETHIKSFTAKCPGIAQAQRGTFAGMGSPPSLGYLKKLGITAVELLPLQHHADEKMIVDRGLRNYWGYATIGFFAPDFRFSSSGCLGGQVNEFKGMVKAFHAAGIEVILDVVYNHTPEGNGMGPVLCFKGIDAPSYYTLDSRSPDKFIDYTGTGNTLAVEHPWVLRMVIDSLRYWVADMHVDGFRFDLAATLGREHGRFNPQSAFFRAIAKDPILSRVKVIAEPWDIGPDGYHVGRFPSPWREWNDKFRDGFRQFWNGCTKDTDSIQKRLAGSADVFPHDQRGPTAGINFITCHDGFTLHDLVSYDQKHNEANLEENHDGSSCNFSRNYGVEGQTVDPAIRSLRIKQMKNFLASLLLSKGVPMLLGGDEMARTQNGNNNAYCHDNDINYFDWDLDPDRAALLQFTRKLIRLRRRHGPIKSAAKVLRPAAVVGDDAEQKAAKAALGIGWKAGSGKNCTHYALLMNAEQEPVRFHLVSSVSKWKRLVSTGKTTAKPPASMVIEGMSLVLLCRGRSVGKL